MHLGQQSNTVEYIVAAERLRVVNGGEKNIKEKLKITKIVNIWIK